jgi:hypothetical protein
MDLVRKRADKTTLIKLREPPCIICIYIYIYTQIIVTRDGGQLETAVKEGDIVEVLRLLRSQRGRTLINTADSRGWSPLHHAISQVCMYMYVCVCICMYVYV